MNKMPNKQGIGTEKTLRTKLGKEGHKALATWALDCAEHVLPFFEKKYPKDDRPQKAIEAGRAWVRGKITVGEARTAAFAAHAAARDVKDNLTKTVARATGQAVATAHMAGHARHAADYAAAAAEIAGNIGEREWQYRHLPEYLRQIVFPTK